MLHMWNTWRCSGCSTASLHPSTGACVCTSALTGLVLPVSTVNINHLHTHTMCTSVDVCVLTYSIESQSGTQCKRTAVLLIKHILIHLLYNLSCSFCVCSDDCVSLIESTENTARSFFLLCLVIKKEGYICLPGETLVVQPASLKRASLHI